MTDEQLAHRIQVEKNRIYRQNLRIRASFVKTGNASTFMKDIEQVYPVEKATPLELKAVLRTYQKQSLAFMLRNEKEPDDNHWAVGEFESSVKTHSRSLRNGMKRSVSGVDIPLIKVRGGILADEVGMGKTMVSISLILANPCPTGWKSAWAWSERNSHGTMKVKTTLITTTPTLLGQWYDEFIKFAPSLNVVCCHNSGEKFQQWRKQLSAKKLDLTNVDVILVSNRMINIALSIPNVQFWRIMMDECHESKSSIKIASPNMW